jgi:hypothetical protein
VRPTTLCSPRPVKIAPLDSRYSMAPSRTRSKSPGKRAQSTKNVFEYEKVVDEMRFEGESLYRVRWQGYGSEHDTWEPTSSFLSRGVGSLVEDYYHRVRANDKHAEHFRLGLFEWLCLCAFLLSTPICMFLVFGLSMDKEKCGIANAYGFSVGYCLLYVGSLIPG